MHTPRVARLFDWILLAGFAFLPGCWQPPRPTPRQLDRGLVWMFPGINGREWFADAYRGLRDGGVEAAIRVHDWKGAEIVANLSDYHRNRAAAAVIAAELAAYHAEHPGRPIDLVGYSGGGGLAIMVAEALPPEVRLRNVVLAQPAVSRDYGLCPALQHVDGRMVNFYCPSDWVILGAGTAVFGTIDRRHAASAGKEGFDLQAAVPDEHMRDLVEQRPWSWDMLWAGHVGGHLGMAMREWNKRYVAPLLPPDTAPDIRPRFDYPVQLRPIAERIIQDNLEDLDWQSRHKLFKLGFLPGDYWEEQFQWSAM